MSFYYWKRPDSIPYPTTWARFQAKDIDSENLVEYRIQDVTEDNFEDVYKYMTEYFFYDDPLNAGCRLVDDKLAYKEIYNDWKKVITQRLSLVCYKESTNEIVGCNLLRIKIKGLNYPEVKIELKANQMIEGAMEYTRSLFDVYQHYNVDKYLSSLGLSVSVKYRGRGIAQQLLMARVPLCKAIGVKITTTTFVGISSQNLAKKVGFEENMRLTYDQLAEAGFKFDTPEEYLITMSLKIN